MTNSVVFGKALRKDFGFEPSYVPLNHGSFGAYPEVVKQQQREYQDKAREHPDRWGRFEMYPLLQDNLNSLGRLMNCDPQDLAFAANSSQAANTILRSYPFKKGDKILCYHTAYCFVDKTLEFIRDQYQVQLVRIQLDYPLEDDEIIELTKQAIECEHAKTDEPRIKMALIDAISAAPAVRFPFEAITRLVKEHNILSLIDGAHALGQIEVDIQAVDPDFFFSNCHKWLNLPFGFAVLYVSKRYQGWIHPTTITSAYEHHDDPADTTSFRKEFAPPTVDCSSYLSVNAALKYRESIGGEEAIRAYIHDIAVQGGALVADILGTRVLENSTKTLTAGIVSVELPPFKTSMSDAEIISYFVKKLIYEHNTAATTYKNNGKWWARLCGQVYVDLDDFAYAGRAIKAVIDEIQ